MYQVSFNKPTCANKPVARATPVRAQQNGAVRPKELIASTLVAASVIIGNSPAIAQQVYTPSTSDSGDLLKKLDKLPALKEYPGETRDLKNNSPSGLAVKQEQRVMDQALEEGNKKLGKSQQSPSPPANQNQVNLPNPYSGSTSSIAGKGDNLDKEVTKEEKQQEQESPENIAGEREYKPNPPATPSKSSSFVV